jgi:hypothetical protein
MPAFHGSSSNCGFKLLQVKDDDTPLACLKSWSKLPCPYSIIFFAGEPDGPAGKLAAYIGKHKLGNVVTAGKLRALGTEDKQVQAWLWNVEKETIAKHLANPPAAKVRRLTMKVKKVAEG